MAREGREFELLIKKLESHSWPEGTDIFSPGYLPDKITGQEREVDILITRQVGTVSLKLAIECRNRNRKQDVSWVEQAKSKFQDIRIDKGILVSTSGLSEPALAKAKSYNIEVRSFENCSPESISRWFKVSHLEFGIVKYQLLHASLRIDPQNIGNAVLPSSSNETALFSKKSKNWHSLKEIFEQLVEEKDLKTLVPWDGELHDQKCRFIYENPLDRFQIRSSGKLIDVEEIIIAFQMVVEQKKVPVSTISKYNSGDRNIATRIEFDTLGAAGESRVVFTRLENGVVILETENEE